MTTIILNRLKYPPCDIFSSGYDSYEEVSIKYCCQSMEVSSCFRLQDDKFGIWNGYYEVVDETIDYCPFCGAEVEISIAGTFKMVPVQKKTTTREIKYIKEES